VIYDADGKPNTLRYKAVKAILLNEFLKGHRTVQELKSNAAKQNFIPASAIGEGNATIGQQQKQIETLTTGLQEVSAQLEANKLAPQVVNNP